MIRRIYMLLWVAFRWHVRAALHVGIITRKAVDMERQIQVMFGTTQRGFSWKLFMNSTCCRLTLCNL